MAELIVLNQGNAILNLHASKEIAKFERQIKELKEAEEDLKKKILEEMEAKNIKKLITEEMTITYKASYDKESFDGKQFRAEHPDLYDSYIKMSPCKASIMIKLKEEKSDE